MNDKLINNVDRHIPEVDTLVTRLNRTKEWMDGHGDSLNMWEADINKRINDVSSDGMSQETAHLRILDEVAGANAGVTSPYFDYVTPNQVRLRLPTSLSSQQMEEIRYLI